MKKLDQKTIEMSTEKDTFMKPHQTASIFVKVFIFSKKFKNYFNRWHHPAILAFVMNSYSEI